MSASVDSELDLLARQLGERLADLRGQFQEAIASYSVKVQGQLSEVGEALAADVGQLSAPDRRLRERALRRALERLDALELKPEKGRRRDLKAVAKAAADLSRITESL